MPQIGVCRSVGQQSAPLQLPRVWHTRFDSVLDLPIRLGDRCRGGSGVWPKVSSKLNMGCSLLMCRVNKSSLRSITKALMPTCVPDGPSSSVNCVSRLGAWLDFICASIVLSVSTRSISISTFPPVALFCAYRRAGITLVSLSTSRVARPQQCRQVGKLPVRYIIGSGAVLCGFMVSGEAKQTAGAALRQRMPSDVFVR